MEPFKPERLPVYTILLAMLYNPSKLRFPTVGPLPAGLEEQPLVGKEGLVRPWRKAKPVLSVVAGYQV